MPATSGRVIAGRYSLEETIGRGDTGVVWRAHDRLLDREVAVKEVVLPPGAIDEQAAADLDLQMKRTALAAAQIGDPGIVTVYDLARDGGQLWLVMELIPSRSLDSILTSDGPLSEPRATRIGQQLLAALTAAHAAGSLHGDVSPGNVLIAADQSGEDAGERALLTDFGIARPAGDSQLAMLGLASGSSGFTAPERLRGAEATPASDLWSLGATLYAAVEGHGPYDPEGRTDAGPADPDETPPAARSAGQLAPLIAALMRAEPSARPSAAVAGQMLAGDLAAMDVRDVLDVQDEPAAPAIAVATETVPAETVIAAAPPAPDPVPTPDAIAAPDPVVEQSPARRRRRLVILARVLVVVIALLVGGYLFREGQVSKHLSDTPPADPPATAPANASATAPADPSGSADPSPTPNRKSATPVPTRLPSVSAAPSIVQAIDLGALPAPGDYTSERYSAARLGTSAGFAIAVPPDWQAFPSGREVTLSAPDGDFVQVDLTRHAKSNMVAEAKYLKATRRADFPGYQRIYSPPNQPPKKFFQPATILRTLGAVWEFDCLSASGVRLREDVLLFNLGGQSYTIYAGGPAGQHDNSWNLDSLGIVSTILRTFTPVAS